MTRELTFLDIPTNNVQIFVCCYHPGVVQNCQRDCVCIIWVTQIVQ